MMATKAEKNFEKALLELAGYYDPPAEGAKRRAGGAMSRDLDVVTLTGAEYDALTQRADDWYALTQGHRKNAPPLAGWLVELARRCNMETAK